MWGGPGDDVIRSNIDIEEPQLDAAASGPFLLYGGGGDDVVGLSSPYDELGLHDSCRTTIRCTFVAFGGAGRDVLSFRHTYGDVHADLESGDITYAGGRADVVGFEDVDGSRREDVILGTDGPNHVDGNGKNDRLYGRGGNDVLDGGNGRDAAYGGSGRDRCVAELQSSC